MNAQRKEYFVVVRPPNKVNPNPLPEPAIDEEHARAMATVKNYESPDLGPYRVVRLVEAE